MLVFVGWQSGRGRLRRFVAGESRGEKKSRCRERLDSAEKISRLRFVCFFFLFFFTRFGAFWVLRLLFANFDLSNFFGPITAHRVLFMDPQISLFSNFFIKNGSHDTIHIFKNYFATVFFSFQFQFSVFSCIQMDPQTQTRGLILETRKGVRVSKGKRAKKVRWVPTTTTLVILFALWRICLFLK